jgi:hypothetical protein
VPLWVALSDAVDKFPSQSDKLVELVIQLQHLPDGKGVLGPDPWFSNLPMFNSFWTEFIEMRCIPCVAENLQAIHN